MLLTSVGNDSKSLVPRIRRNRKGSSCSTGAKRTCLACWMSRETLLASKSVRTSSSACNRPEVLNQLLGKAARAAGSKGDGLCIISTHQCHQQGEAQTEPATDFHGNAGEHQTCLLTASGGGISDDWPGDPLPWSPVSREPRSMPELWCPPCCGGRRVTAAG